MSKITIAIKTASCFIFLIISTFNLSAKTPEFADLNQVERRSFELLNRAAQNFMQDFITTAADRAKANDNHKLAQRVRMLVDQRKSTPVVRQEFDIPAYDVLNSVAVLAPNLPSNKSWQAISSSDFSALYGDGCNFASGACNTPFAKKMQNLLPALQRASSFQQLSQINRTVNKAITYRDDIKAFGKSDYWATPAELALRGAGDCEDFAIAKYWALRALGYDQSQLQLIVLKDTRRNLYHAVLAVHVGGNTFILDNLSNNIAEQSAFPNYMPIFSFVADVAYIHGRSKPNTAKVQLVASN
ncbi:putative transglutaminase-like cysteine proteinase [Maritalea mobilis]|uniref:Putative transglutaminase-like cysteine proteinase n=1 Tax=Maritalea mobilis TaxID=483324 RepID=A0A4R6VTM9_9HYPH|nr:transglutaminase-like cysteine peptidase [Maritalea mobilis]TDQ66017.1 putative transglutaminase-like cysteine proteinase [Maritalea mobilis]